MAIMELRDELGCRIVLRREEIAAIYIAAPFTASLGRVTPLEGRRSERVHYKWREKSTDQFGRPKNKIK